MASRREEEKYIDEAGWKVFHETTECSKCTVRSSIVVPVDVQGAFDGWIQHIWVNGGHGKAASRVVLEKDGQGRGLIGCIRRVSGGIREEIVSAGCPRPSSASISSILYTMLDGSPIPVENYYGFVQFIPETDTSTRIVWEARFNPSFIGSVLCCGGVIVRWVLHYAFNVILQEFQTFEHKKLRVI